MAALCSRAGRVARYGAILALGVMVLAMLAATVPSLLGDETFVVEGRTMQPALQSGDLAVIRPTRVDQLVAGDIIVYRTPVDASMVVTRRVLHAESDPSTATWKLQVRGDSEPSSEQISVPASSQLGRMELSVPRLGTLVSVGNGLAGKALLVGVPLVLLALAQRRRPSRETSPAKPQTKVDAARVAALLASGQRALAAGFPELALRAAEGALVLEPDSAAAALLKRIAQSALESQHANAVA